MCVCVDLGRTRENPARENAAGTGRVPNDANTHENVHYNACGIMAPAPWLVHYISNYESFGTQPPLNAGLP